MVWICGTCNQIFTNKIILNVVITKKISCLSNTPLIEAGVPALPGVLQSKMLAKAKNGLMVPESRVTCARSGLPKDQTKWLHSLMTFVVLETSKPAGGLPKLRFTETPRAFTINKRIRNLRRMARFHSVFSIASCKYTSLLRRPVFYRTSPRCAKF
jgi:hypothetical protein